MGERPSVVHVSSVHPAGDTRIYHRECRALAEAGYAVTLLTADPEGGASAERWARVVRVPVPRTRAARATVGMWRMREAALATGAALFHLHDPELLPIAPSLRRRGAKVVYDAHEDLAAQVLEKGWIPPWLRAPVSRAVGWLLPRMTSRTDAVVAATPDIAARYGAARTEVVRNFPIVAELAPAATSPPYGERPPRVVYVGASITVPRGARQMVAAMRSLGRSVPGAELALAGQLLPASLGPELLRGVEPGTVSVLGRLDREGVRDLLGTARVGLIVEHPTVGYLRSLPVKLFEYMAAGLPIVASDFPLWREIVGSAGCGLLVDPFDPAAIAEALRTLLSDPVTAEAMGRRGREAVEDRYGWASESERLVGLYEELLGRGVRHEVAR